MPRMGLFRLWPFSRSSHLEIAHAKRAQRSRAVAVAPPITEGHQVFTRATATEIVSRIGKGEWTASQVVEAYIARAAHAHAITNCVTEVMFTWAREQAEELDAEFASTKKLRGPLHGVPASFKDQFDVIGFDTTLGFSQWANKPATMNADLVQQFLSAGAVVFVKTNIPQTLFSFECSNPVWGRTTHPLNDSYSSGGSSGGEAVLLSMDGSAIGVGSDLAGSLRIPAAYCGIYSLKPSFGRISLAGIRGPIPGFESVKVVVGPMGRSVEDVELMSRLMIGAPGYDQNVSPLPYRDVKLPEKLRFGYYTSDGYVKASPACKRAVLETVEALRRDGHECVAIDDSLDGPKAFNIVIGLISGDGYKKMLSHLGPDPLDEAMLSTTRLPKLPSVMRSIFAWVIETFYRDKVFADTVRSMRVRTVYQYTELLAEKQMYLRSFFGKVWRKHNIDGIIAPVQAVPQIPNGGCNNYSTLVAGTALYNLLDFAVGCLPVTRVDPTLDQITEEWNTELGHGSTIIENGLYRGKDPLYNPSAMEGMPVGIQIVGKKWEEEKVVGMMHVVDQALGEDRGFGPGSWDLQMKMNGQISMSMRV